ncbi:MAG TPA: efflux transporter periplasmic adaptor subunit [Methylococcaceae bacterium]|nr:efflux transporter periplasmic adaptor subunit [Methylococcaceae bacterium]
MSVMPFMSPMVNMVKKKMRCFMGRQLFFSLALAWLLSACHSAPESPKPPTAPPPTVKVAQVLSKEITPWDEYTGRIEAVNEVQLRARVSGYIEKVQFNAGEKVKKGDVLFLIDSRPYKSQLNYATAEQAKASVKYEFAKNDLARAEQLIAEKAISLEELDSRTHAVHEALAVLDAAKATVYAAQLNVSYCEIRAPINGRISRALFTEGNLVTPSDNAVLATIVSLNPVYVYVDVDEQAMLHYRARSNSQDFNLNGAPVSLTLNSDVGRDFQGYIDYIAPKEDTKTGTITLRGVFDNTDELLSPGFFARMRVRSAAPYRAQLLPSRAIGVDQSQSFVWVLKDDNHVEYRKVTLGASEKNWRVIEAGVSAQEWVVIDGLQKMRPNIQVNPERLDVANLAE